jgi:hypothetical protein
MACNNTRPYVGLCASEAVMTRIDLTFDELRALIYQQLVETSRSYLGGKPSDALKRMERLIELQRKVVDVSRATASGKSAA